MSIEREVNIVEPDIKRVEILNELRSVRNQLGHALVEAGHLEESASQTSIHAGRLESIEKKLPDLVTTIKNLLLKEEELLKELESSHSGNSKGLSPAA